MDTLTVEGIGKRVDGVYECDIGGMIGDVSSAEALTNDEAHLVKRMSGVRGNELIEAFLAGDTDMRMALAIIVAARHGKVLDERVLRKATIGATMFAFGADVEDAVDVPPTTEGETPSTDGGKLSSSNSAGLPATDPSPTGAHD